MQPAEFQTSGSSLSENVLLRSEVEGEPTDHANRKGTVTKITTH